MSENKAVEVYNLSKSFGNIKVIDNISFSVDKGDIFGFLGPNGSGKTTTIRMLLSLINPDNGTIVLNSHDVKKEYKKAYSKVGAIVEVPKFYPYLSGYENLMLMANLKPKISKERIESVLSLVGLLERANDKFKTYSLGMKQRLGIANALLNNPELIILDEPTNGLDPQGMRDIRELIVNLVKNHGMTVFLSSHLLYEVEQICNKVAIISKGNVIAQGNVNDLLMTESEVVYLYTDMKEEALNIAKNNEIFRNVDVFEEGIIIRIEKEKSSTALKLFVEAGIEVEYFVPKRQSLESLFIKLTEGGSKIV